MLRSKSLISCEGTGGRHHNFSLMPGLIEKSNFVSPKKLFWGNFDCSNCNCVGVLIYFSADDKFEWKRFENCDVIPSNWFPRGR